jgi:hypothetical protein
MQIINTISSGVRLNSCPFKFKLVFLFQGHTIEWFDFLPSDNPHSVFEIFKVSVIQIGKDLISCCSEDNKNKKYK